MVCLGIHDFLKGNSMEVSDSPLLFSERLEADRLANEWFSDHPRASRCVMNCITALEANGYVVRYANGPAPRYTDLAPNQYPLADI